jgi:hypothetical protein
MCCGQKRAELRNSQQSASTQSVPAHYSGSSLAQASSSQRSMLQVTQLALPHLLADQQTRSSQPQPPTPVPTPQSSISVRYLERSSIRVRGVVSGLYYEFSDSRPIQWVDTRDAPYLLNQRFFRRFS